MNKIIKLDYEEFKELERKAKMVDDDQMYIRIEEHNKSFYYYNYKYTVKASSSKEELSKYIEDKVKEIIDFDTKIENIKKSLEEEKVKEVEGIARHLHERFSEKETQLNMYKQNSDSFVKVSNNTLYKLFHFFKLM
jgi:hypothetical protein